MDYDTDRPEMLPLVPPSTRRVLDVGCSTGRFGESLRRLHPTAELWGIDPRPHPSDRPQPYDTRLVGRFPDDLDPGERFDCIVFNDVLEHLVDPWGALRSTHGFLDPGAVIVVSIPNVRHYSVVRPLIVNGRWDYQDSGILDRTHLRFYTRATAIELLESTGFSVSTSVRIKWAGTGTTGRLPMLNRILRGRLDDFLAQQYGIVARSRYGSLEKKG